jgi:ankyrin repeat protein
MKRTPLLVAAECGYLDIVHLLVEYGGDVTAKDKDMNSGPASNMKDVLRHGTLSFSKSYSG